MADLPVDGVGLLRSEFLISALGRHPATVPADRLRAHLEDGLRTVAEAFSPRPVLFRALDAKSNEMRSLLGGDEHEPEEENPALGLRGASRILADPTHFLLEADVVAGLRAAGCDNLHLMVPFVRTADEARACRELIEPQLSRDPDLELWVMAEVPAFARAVGELGDVVHGVSVGTNDMTQMLYGVDRDNSAVTSLYDDTGDVVISTIVEIVKDARRAGLRTSICGDAPSRSPQAFERFVAAGTDALSLSPDAVRALLAERSAHRHGGGIVL
jgi:pyruvate,water dikinase